jgi:serine/threonine-protein kinase
MATFVLVLAYAFLAFALLPLHAVLPKKTFVLASLLSLALVVFFGVALQPFGKKTATTTHALLAQPGAPAPATLERFLSALKPEERAKLEKARRDFLAAESRPLTAPTPGRMPKQAPVVLQDFTDIKCGHCQTAEVVLTQLLRAMPEGSVAVEPRYYPLDAECNPSLRRPGEPLPSGKGVRCAAALVQICLEGAADFAKLRGALFHAAGRLATREDVLVIASTGQTSRTQLEACMDSPDALARLHADIALAQSHGIRGTPFFLLNGKPVGFAPSFWTAMVLAKGHAEDAAFTAAP